MKCLLPLGAPTLHQQSGQVGAAPAAPEPCPSLRNPHWSLQSCPNHPALGYSGASPLKIIAQYFKERENPV